MSISFFTCHDEETNIWMDCLRRSFFLSFGESYLEYPHELKIGQENEPWTRQNVLYRSCLEEGDDEKYRNVSQTSFSCSCLMFKPLLTKQCCTATLVGAREAQTSW